MLYILGNVCGIAFVIYGAMLIGLGMVEAIKLVKERLN